MKSLEGKAALVTGASRGIGSATAIAFAKAGVTRIGLHFFSNRSGAEETADAVRKHGAEPVLLEADLGASEGIAALRSQIETSLPGIDLLVNNAGHLVGRAKLLDCTEDFYDRVMTLNTKSVWFVSQTVVPHMLQKGGGAIVNVSSIAARHGGGPGATIYAAAKAAVSAITKGMAKELAAKGIRVNAVSPGVVDNDFHARYSTREMLDNMLAGVPAGQLGTNEEVADTIVFLCSDSSRYIHGQTIEINGGMYMV
jgi:3-oxoacyl-[acyl-carrier protein] reductase